MTGARIAVGETAGHECQDFDRIPVIDVTDLRDGDPEARRRVAGEIGRALSEVGFFYVSGHGIPDRVIASAFAHAAGFFALPEARKDAVSFLRSENHRGYFAIGSENVSPGQEWDDKEGFDLGMEAEAPGTVPDRDALRGRNQWPDGLPGFREDVEAFYDELVVLGRLLCRACALALDLPETHFDASAEVPESRLRLLHYPPAPDGDRTGAGAHTDCGYLTILAQDDIGGLEIQNHGGDWIAARPIPGTLVINVGRLMADLTDGRFVATRHRVRSHPTRHRYSVPLFFNPNFDLEVPAFESLLGRPATCSVTTAGGYIRQCYDEIRSPEARLRPGGRAGE